MNITVKKLNIKQIQQYNSVAKLERIINAMLKYDLTPFDVYVKFDFSPESKLIPRQNVLDMTDITNRQKSYVEVAKLLNEVIQLAYKGIDKETPEENELS